MYVFHVAAKRFEQTIATPRENEGHKPSGLGGRLILVVSLSIRQLKIL